MGKKGNWFSTVKKALSPDSKKSKKKWFGKQKLETSEIYSQTHKAPPLPPPEEIKVTNIESQYNHHHVAEIATAMDTEEPGPSVQITALGAEASIIARFGGKSKDEVAAIKIQTAFLLE